MQIWYFVINLLLMCLPISWYTIYQMYKDIQKKDQIIRFQDSVIKNSKLYAEV